MKRREGFENQVLILVPPEMYRKSDEITRQLYITDIGYFPRAEDHYVERTGGCPADILIVCTNGSGYAVTPRGRFEVKKGEAFFLPPAEPHAYGSTDPGWWEIYWIHFSGPLAGRMRERINGCKSSDQEYTGSFPLNLGKESRLIFSRICATLSEGISPISYETACGQLWNLFSSLNRDRKQGTGISRGTIRECLALMEERVGGSLTLGELSEKAGMTPQYLCRFFKENTGHPPMEHYVRLKIQRACAFLDMTSERINEISCQVGFDDPYYFTRTFKRIMGMPPREYRRRQK